MIRLTFVSEYQHSEPREFPTDDVGVALALFARGSFGSGERAGPTPWVGAFIIERDDEQMTPHEIAQAFRSIASKERLWADRSPAALNQPQTGPEAGGSSRKGRS